MADRDEGAAELPDRVGTFASGRGELSERHEEMKKS